MKNCIQLPHSFTSYDICIVLPNICNVFVYWSFDGCYSHRNCYHTSSLEMFWVISLNVWLSCNFCRAYIIHLKLFIWTMNINIEFGITKDTVCEHSDAIWYVERKALATSKNNLHYGNITLKITLKIQALWNMKLHW